MNNSYVVKELDTNFYIAPYGALSTLDFAELMTFENATRSVRILNSFTEKKYACEKVSIYIVDDDDDDEKEN